MPKCPFHHIDAACKGVEGRPKLLGIGILVGFEIGPSNIDIGYWTLLDFIGLYWTLLDDIGLIGHCNGEESNKSNIDIGRVIGLDIGFQYQTRKNSLPLLYPTLQYCKVRCGYKFKFQNNWFL